MYLSVFDIQPMLSTTTTVGLFSTLYFSCMLIKYCIESRQSKNSPLQDFDKLIQQIENDSSTHEKNYLETKILANKMKIHIFSKMIEKI